MVKSKVVTTTADKRFLTNKPAEKPVAKPAEKPAEKSAEKPAEKK